MWNSEGNEEKQSETKDIYQISVGKLKASGTIFDVMEHFEEASGCSE